jgi:hypothetical protein
MWTPVRSSSANRQIVHCRGRVDDRGNLEFDVDVTSSGHFARMLSGRGNIDPAVTAAIVLGVAPPAIQASVDNITALSPDEVLTHIVGRIIGWAVVEPQRMVMRPKLAGWMASDTLAGRPDPGWVGFPMTAFDTLSIRFPEGWTPELWPAAVFQPRFLGECGEARSFSDGQLTIVRHVRWDGSGRSESDIAGSAEVRRSYREASNAEWIFRLIGSPRLPDSTVKTDQTSDSTKPAGSGDSRSGAKGGRK